MQRLPKQPKSFYLIFFIELWERFGFYGVQALLVLYLVESLGFTDAEADQLFSTFIALAYLLPIIGGAIGDRILGAQRTLLLGAFVLMFGYLLLSIPIFSTNATVLGTLSVIIVGNGLFKANPSSLLSKVYQGTSYNLDSGFTLYYMSINIGSLISMNLTPILNKWYGWHIAFSVCFLGLVIAIVNFLWGKHLFSHLESELNRKKLSVRYFVLGLFFLISSIAICYFLLRFYQVTFFLSLFVMASSFIIYGFLIKRSNPSERNGMLLFIFLFFQSIIFFVLQYQMPTSLTLFALRNVEHAIGTIPIQPGQFQMLNAFWIIFLSPIFARCYQRMQRQGSDLSLPAKFALGLLLCGLAFLSLSLGSLFDHEGIISGLWLVLFYGLQSAGELLISALGLSVVARYIPQRYIGFVMGLWFLSASLGSMVAGKVAAMASIPSTTVLNPRISLLVYDHLFTQIGTMTIIAAMIMFISFPFLKKLSQRAERV